MQQDTVLEMFPFVAKISDEARQVFDRNVVYTEHDKKSRFIEKGEDVAGICLVTQGALRVFNMHPSGKETTLYTVTSGQSCLLAVNCVFSGVAYPAWVNVDQENTKIISIPAAAFRTLYQMDETIRDFTFEVLSLRVFDLMTRLEEVSLYGLDRRLASYLVRAADGEGVISATHHDIAAELGTAREVVSRILLELKKKALVETSRGSIRVLSMKKLAGYGEG